MCSRNIHNPSRRETEIPRGGGGCPKRDNFRGDEGLTTEVFSRGLRKIGELLIKQSFCVEQAISYFIVTGVSKQVLLFELIIFYLRSAKCFFHGICDSFL